MFFVYSWDPVGKYFSLLGDFHSNYDSGLKNLERVFRLQVLNFERRKRSFTSTHYSISTAGPDSWTRVVVHLYIIQRNRERGTMFGVHSVRHRLQFPRSCVRFMNKNSLAVVIYIYYLYFIRHELWNCA